MADLGFVPSRSSATLASVMQKLLDNWALLPTSVQEQLDARRLHFCDELLALKDFQRSYKLIEFLQWLESVHEVAASAGTELAAGKGPIIRSGFIQISTAQVQQLRSVLEDMPARAPKASIELPFHVNIEFTAKIDMNAEQPLIVRLNPALSLAEEQTNSIMVIFEELSKPVPLEMSLSATGFQEQTGDWTRTIYVFSTGASLPAIFLLRAGNTLGAQRLMLSFHPSGRVLFQTEIVAPSRDVMR